MKAPEVLKVLSDTCRRRHLSYATEKSYRSWALSYITAIGKLPKAWPSERKAEAFLTGLAKRDVAAATQNQALNAIAFLYKDVLGTPLGTVDALRVKRPATVREALSVEDVRALLTEMPSVADATACLVVRLLYGCGLRVSEPLELRIKDVDLEGARLIIRSAKGNKDRIVPLPQCVLPEMEAQLRVARAVLKSDAAAGLPMALPTALAAKYSKSAFQEPWAWVFPAQAPSDHPRTGQRVRWRLHEVTIQRAVRAAAAKAGIAVRVTPHVLRHSYATHAHASGAPARDLQEVLGHGKLETTMRYLRPAFGVPSPLDALVEG
jgi:site-specific recombinase XerD